MAVIFSRADLDRVKATLDNVTSVGQAQAVVDSTVRFTNEVANTIYQSFFEDAWRTQARKDLFAYGESVKRAAKALAGGDSKLPVGPAWKDLRPAVQTAWNYALIVKGQFPPGETSDAERAGAAMKNAADSLIYGVSQAPANISKATAVAVKTTAKAVKAVTVAAADIAGATAAAALGPVKWILFGLAGIAVVGGIGYLVLTRKVGG